MKKIVTTLCMALLALAVLTACGGRGNRPYEEGTAPDADAYFGAAEQHLRIATHPHSEAQIRLAVRHLAADMATRGITLTYNISVYPTGYFTRAGRASDTFLPFPSYFHIDDYDIVHSFDLGGLAHLANTGQLADIITLMNNDPHTGPPHFFMEVLEANARNGHVYSAPIAFTMEMVGVNMYNSPPWLRQAFAERESISLLALFDYYLERPGWMGIILSMFSTILHFSLDTIRMTHDAYGNLYRDVPVFPIPHWHLFTHAMNHYQGDTLLRMLEAILAVGEDRVTAANIRPDIGRWGTDMDTSLLFMVIEASEDVLPPRWQGTQARFIHYYAEYFRHERNLFLSTMRAGTGAMLSVDFTLLDDGWNIHMLQALIGTPGGYFGHFLPLVTPEGALVVQAAPFGELAINAQGNTVMAWELFKRIPARLTTSRNLTTPHVVFTQLQVPVAEATYFRAMPIPITRLDLEENLQHMMTSMLNDMQDLTYRYGYRDEWHLGIPHATTGRKSPSKLLPV